MEKESNFRDTIGRGITMWVIIATGLLGVLGIVLAILYVALSENRTDGLAEAKSILQFIFSALLPLWGTWIGTVLAYYFSKENFEAANKSVRDLVGQMNSGDKLKAVSVSEVMIPYQKMIKTELSTTDEADGLIVKDLFDGLIANKIRRSLIFKDGCILYVLHKSILAEFLLRNSDPSLTLAQFKQDQDKDIQNAIINGAPTIKKDSTLLDVKFLMENLQGCQDVFVTETGKKTEKVLGWVSNVDVFNYSKA